MLPRTGPLEVKWTPNEHDSGRWHDAFKIKTGRCRVQRRRIFLNGGVAYTAILNSLPIRS